MGLVISVVCYLQADIPVIQAFLSLPGDEASVRGLSQIIFPKVSVIMMLGGGGGV